MKLDLSVAALMNAGVLSKGEDGYVFNNAAYHKLLYRSDEPKTYSPVQQDTIAEKIIKTTIAIEGGYADLPGDRGGKTMFGIASNFFPELKSKIESKTLTSEEAIAFYKKMFYDRYKIADIKSDRLKFFVFDTMVMGATSGIFVRRALRKLGVDVPIYSPDSSRKNYMNTELRNVLKNIEENNPIVSLFLKMMRDQAHSDARDYNVLFGTKYVSGYANRYRKRALTALYSAYNISTSIASYDDRQKIRLHIERLA